MLSRLTFGVFDWLAVPAAIVLAAAAALVILR